MRVFPALLILFTTGCRQGGPQFAARSALDESVVTQQAQRIAPEGAGTWRASVDNGDKPGIGIELTRRADKLTGRVFLLQSGRPHDFTAGSPRPMAIEHVTDTEIRFAVDWLPDVHDKMVLRLTSPVRGQRFLGILEPADHSGTPRDYEFVRDEKAYWHRYENDGT